VRKLLLWLALFCLVTAGPLQAKDFAGGEWFNKSTVTPRQLVEAYILRDLTGDCGDGDSSIYRLQLITFSPSYDGGLLLPWGEYNAAYDPLVIVSAWRILEIKQTSATTAVAKVLYHVLARTTGWLSIDHVKDESLSHLRRLHRAKPGEIEVVTLHLKWIHKPGLVILGTKEPDEIGWRIVDPPAPRVRPAAVVNWTEKWIEVTKWYETNPKYRTERFRRRLERRYFEHELAVVKPLVALDPLPPLDQAPLAEPKEDHAP